MCKATEHLQVVSMVIIHIALMNCFINLPIRLGFGFVFFLLPFSSTPLLCYSVLEVKHVCVKCIISDTQTHMDARPEINTVPLLPPQELGAGQPSGLR